MITRWFVYTKPDGKARYRHIAVYSTKAEAIAAAQDFAPSYVQGVDDSGKTATDKIVVHK